MMRPRTCGFRTGQSFWSVLVTVMKSLPRKMRATPSMRNRLSASGERAALSAASKSAVPRSITMRPGRNFSVAGFGVSSVWMNILVSRDKAASGQRMSDHSRNMGEGLTRFNPKLIMGL